MNKYLLSFLLLFLLIPNLSLASSRSDIESRIEEINQEISELKAELKALKSQLNSSSSEKSSKKNRDGEKIETFTILNIETGTVDREKIVVLADIRVYAGTKDLNGDSFSSSTYFLGSASPSQIQYSCPAIIKKGTYTTCRIKMKSFPISGSYSYVIKNPSIKSLDGKNTYKTEMIVEDSFVAR